jgi:NitT/TauT family transport system substrate-binding protein
MLTGAYRRRQQLIAIKSKKANRGGNPGNQKIVYGRENLMGISKGIGAFAIGVAVLWPVAGAAQAPRANGETLNIQTYAGTTGNMHAVIAARKGFCEKYNFRCELKTINSGILGLQALVGKTIDVAQTGTEITASTVAAGGDVAIVGISLPNNVVFLAARSDVSLPNRAKGYPAVMQDFKGLKIGVPARGAGAEVFAHAMLREAGLQPSDVTFVAVGGPATAYTSLVVGRQVDAVVMFEPLKHVCLHTKACAMVVDMTVGEGPKEVRNMNGASVPLVMRREMAAGNPALMAAFYAAMRDAAAWFNEPGNFEDLVKIYTPLISFGDLAGADELRRTWLKDAIATYSKDLKVDRAAVKATLDFHAVSQDRGKPLDAAAVVWDQAP